MKEICSIENDPCPKLLKLLTNPWVNRIVVEHKDHLTHFDYTYIEQLLKMQNRRMEVIDLAENSNEVLIKDFVSSVTSFYAHLYGQRCSRRKTKRLIAEITPSPVPSISSPGK